MSFNWETNSWGGPSGPNTNMNAINLGSNLTAQSPVYASANNARLYVTPNYLLLGDLSSNKSTLTTRAGGYTYGVQPGQSSAFKLAMAKITSSNQGHGLSY